MSLDTLFRLFNHAALAMSCACLLQAERLFMPGPELAIVPVAGVIFIAFGVERRWALTNGGANLCAVFIALGGTWWIFMQIYSPSGPVVLPMPTALVPHFGPIVMALLLVKLFRPRVAGDFWVLQGLGLLQVALACVLAGDPRFGLFLTAYFGCGLTALALHHLTNRAACDVRGATLKTAETVSAISDSLRTPHSALRTPHSALRTPRGPFLRRPLLWTPVVALLACALYLATPRGGWPSWNPLTRFGIRGGQVRAQTGYSEEINLNRTGELELDDEAAFSVSAVHVDGRPYTELSYGQRWRGVILDVYHNGRWVLSDFARIRSIAVNRSRFIMQPLPFLGPDQVFLSYQISPRRAGGVFYADPISFGPPNRFLPVGPSEPGGPLPFALFFGTILPIPLGERNEVHYRQVTIPGALPDRTPLAVADREYNLFLDYVQLLRTEPPTEIQDWTQDVLRQLAAEGRYGLTPADRVRENDSGRISPPTAERVARALCAYLAESGDFTYSLDLRREDLSIDPAVDFLCNIRTGHCERFASGLALMLRSCGIPARVVKGFRGAEQQADGVYVVRQSDAHGWVEALVPRAASPYRAARIVSLAASPHDNLFLSAAIACAVDRDACEWIALDPTPAIEAKAAEEFSLWRWWLHQWRRTDQLWQELIVGFGSEQQDNLWSSLASPRGPGRALLRLLALVLGFIALAWLTARVVRRFLGWRRAWRTRSARRQLPAPPAWLARLFGLLAGSLGVRPGPGETPRETAAAGAAVLRSRPAAAALADLPGRVVEMYYRFRYGGLPPSDDERRAIEAELARLETALRAT